MWYFTWVLGLGFALLLLVGGILLKRQTAGSQDRR